MALFQKSTPGGAPGNPLDQVLAMKHQGMGDNQIVHELQKQGYSQEQISQTMNQFNLGPTHQQGYGQSPQDMPPPPEQMQSPYQQSWDAGGSTQNQPTDDAMQISTEQIEEIAEAIIDEKWKEFEKDVRSIIDWKEQTEAHINQLDQKMQDLIANMNALQKGMMGKISEYDRNILNVGTEIKAMEKVFQNVLPSLTENVNKLERMSSALPKRK